MNRWQILESAARLRGLAGEYIDDWASSGGLKLPPPPSAAALAAIPPAIVPAPAVAAVPGRNLSEEEAQAAAMVGVLQPPALAAARGRGRGPGAGGAFPPDLTVRREPWLDLPQAGEGYISMNTSSVVVPAIGATVTVVSFQVPRRRNGNIEWIANQFIGGQGVEGTGVVQWRVLLDGIPAKGYDNIPSTIGTMSNPADLRESPIRIFENQIVSLILANISFVPNQQVLLGMLRGKFWPFEQEGQGTWV